ncbi:MAG: hypothetical protein QOG53_2178, partial [Frankiales bacterium]|nr:hypothetical protein [Frankiales bacterium]
FDVKEKTYAPLTHSFPYDNENFPLP